MSVYTALVEFPRPNKIDCFVHNDGDRETELLSLSIPALSNVIKTFATNVATGAPLSPHLSKLHYGKD